MDQAEPSKRRAGALVGMERASFRYRSKRPVQAVLQERLKALAVERPRWDYRRLHVLLRRGGHRINVERTYRRYRELELAVRRRKRKRVSNDQSSGRSLQVAKSTGQVTAGSTRWTSHFPGLVQLAYVPTLSCCATAAFSYLSPGSVRSASSACRSR